MPEVSVIIPLYFSQNTLRGCLEALALQTFRDFEIVFVDSTPSEQCRGAFDAGELEARYFRSPSRLLPQEARNAGADIATGEILVFTDPDIYPAPDWLEMLVDTHRESGAVIFGPIACHGRRYLELGAHFTKFHICLPGGEARGIQAGWSGSMLIPRLLFESVGRFSTDVQGDSVISARLQARGETLLFQPSALVFHDHDNLSLADFVTERYSRGLEFGKLRASGRLGGKPWSTFQAAVHALGLGLLPLQIFQSVGRIGRDASRSGLLRDFLKVFPVVLVGRSAWGLGVKIAYLRRITQLCRNGLIRDPNVNRIQSRS